MEDRYERRVDYHADRLTRQTKVDFTVFDGSRVQDWLFKSERFFELDDTPEALKVSIASVYLSSQAMDWPKKFHLLSVRRFRISTQVAKITATKLNNLSCCNKLGQIDNLSRNNSCFPRTIFGFQQHSWFV